MAEPAERDPALLLDMLLAARDARSFIDRLDEVAFKTSALHQNAVIRSLEIIGEAASKISPATRSAHPEISWAEIIGMRNRLVHGYDDVSLELVWAVVEHDLVALISALAPLIPNEGAAER